jgi:hypothetical protein
MRLIQKDSQHFQIKILNNKGIFTTNLIKQLMSTIKVSSNIIKTLVRIHSLTQ